MSEIETIGQAIFGKSWMAQIAANLKNAKGKPLTRQTVQNWHRRGKLPEWAKEQLETLVKKRENEIKAIAPIAQKGRKMKSLSFDILTAISAITTNCEPDKNPKMEKGFNCHHDVSPVKFICKTSLDCSAQVTVYDFGDKLKIEVSLAGNLRSDDQNIFKDIIGWYETENEFLDAYKRWQKSSGNSDLDFVQDE